MWIEETKNGKFKFCEQITLDSGKKIKACVTYEKNTKAIQRTAQIELLEKLEKKKQNNPTLDTLTLKQLIDMYMQECNIKQKESTLSNKRYTYNNMVDYFGESTKVSKLDPVSLNKYCVSISPSQLTHIKSMFNWTYKRGYIEVKMSDRLYTLKYNKRHRDKLYLEPDEVKKVFEILGSKNTYRLKTLRLIVEFLILTGMRIGELLALTHDDIEGYDITINKTLTQNSSVSTTKTAAGNRTITINSRAKQVLNEMMFLKRINGIDSNIVFCNRKGNHNSYSNLLPTLRRRTGIRGFHIFRHTHASLLAEQGISLELIQRRLGHESDEITKKVYVHVTEKQKDKEKELFKGLNII